MPPKSRTATALLALCASAACAALSPGGAPATVGGAIAPSRQPAGAHARRAAAARISGSGVATWFGPGFYGNTTACGQRLTRSVVGVANRKLPCGTLIRITYRGRSMTVPVLDRGPYSHGVDWDLTAGAAQALGMGGVARIATRIVGAVPNSPALGSPAAPASFAVAGGARALS